MKKIIFIGALSALALTACKNDDDDNGGFPVGIWKTTGVKLIDGASGQMVMEQPFDACTAKSTINFKSNGQAESHSYTENGTTCADEGVETAAYSYNSSAKTITIDGETYPILNQSASSFDMVVDEDDYTGDGKIDKVALKLVK